MIPRKASASTGHQEASTRCSLASAGKETRISVRFLSPEAMIATGLFSYGPSPDRPADELGHGSQGPRGCRKGDPLEFAGEKDQALDGGDQMGPALGPDDGVNLVEDDRGDPRQHRPAGPGAQEDVQAFRGRDQDLRRTPGHPPALLGGGIAAPGEDADLGEGLARLPEKALQPLQRCEQVPPDVVVQGLQGRDVQDPGLPSPPGAGGKLVDRPEKGGQGFSAPGGSGDQGVFSRGDEGPRPRLDISGRSHPFGEPSPDERVKQGECIPLPVHSLIPFCECRRPRNRSLSPPFPAGAIPNNRPPVDSSGAAALFFSANGGA